MRLAGVARVLERRPVGIGHHQDLAGDGALSDDGDESIVPEAHVLDPVVGGHVGKIPALLRIVKMPRGNNFCADALVRERVRAGPDDGPVSSAHRGRRARGARHARARVSAAGGDRKSTRLNSSHSQISYAVFCLKKKNKPNMTMFRSDSLRSLAAAPRSRRTRCIVWAALTPGEVVLLTPICAGAQKMRASAHPTW